MDNPLNHAYALSSIFTRYKEIHDKAFSFSIASPINVSGRSSLEPLRAYEKELGSLRKELGAIQEQLSVLEKQKARQKTTESEVLDVVIDYTNALSETINQLQFIFRNLRLENAGDEALLGYRKNEYREDCAAYDDSLQEYRRLGSKLKAAFENR
jgi:septal ring factor EnvC (AmiA/AmiB activator)